MSRHLAFVLGILTATTGACRSEPLVVEVEGPRETIAVTEDDGDGVFCPIFLTAKAHGGGRNSYAQWVGGKIETTDFDGRRYSEELTEDDLIDWWKSDRIHSGATQHAGRVHNSRRPNRLAATLQFNFRYRVPETGETRSAYYELRCNAKPELLSRRPAGVRRGG